MLKLILWLSSLFIYLIKTLSGVNITVSGEVLPDAPVMFLANHFTRFETFVVPYVLYTKYNRQCRSLADETVLVGWLGKYMRLAGSISNKNKARDCIISNDLLSGNADWIIYPEGHMVKNKEITLHQGEFCINTATKQGAIFTGSAVLALKSEIIRKRMENINDENKIIQVCNLDYIKKEDVSGHLQLYLVPLSITYYPIRPGKNKLLLLLNKWFHLRRTRLFEELEIEINLLMHGNMHLHFGKPISTKRYIEQYIQEHEGSLDNEVFSNALIDKQRKVLINEVMEQVYGNMQINFDHLFILSLMTIPTLRVCPSYLRTLIYKNIRELRRREDLNLHPQLKNELFKLILDKNYEPFISAIKLALTQKILFQDSEGEYLFDKKLLEKPYDFNKIRVKNTLKVILNEIKWQKEIVQFAKENAKFSEQELRINNFEYLQARDWFYYKKEYMKFYAQEPSKEDIGSPSVWYAPKNKIGLLFSHGYMASPAEAKELAIYLFVRGINVYLPRLRGHGTSPEALKSVQSKDWELDFERGFTAMRQICDQVFIGGFSTGGLLALIHAGKYEVDGVIVINSAQKLNNLKVSYVVPTLNAFNEMVGYLHAKGINEWVDNSHTENPNINYTKHPLNSIAELEKVMTHSNKELGNIRAPILILQGDNDPTVNPQSAAYIYERVQSKVKKLILVPRNNHIILAGEGKEEIFESVYRFIGDILK
jgi:esterase/lipase/1-acyl-sn-glycerol-3-phosphate acyltransferase